MSQPQFLLPLLAVTVRKYTVCAQSWLIFSEIKHPEGKKRSFQLITGQLKFLGTLEWFTLLIKAIRGHCCRSCITFCLALLAVPTLWTTASKCHINGFALFRSLLALPPHVCLFFLCSSLRYSPCPCHDAYVLRFNKFLLCLGSQYVCRFLPTLAIAHMCYAFLHAVLGYDFLKL